MILFRTIFHIFSLFWFLSSLKQWKKEMLSTSLLTLFLMFLALANAALYFTTTFDQVAQFFGIEFASNAAFFICTIVLFLLAKQNSMKAKLLEKKLKQLNQVLAIRDFETRITSK